MFPSVTTLGIFLTSEFCIAVIGNSLLFLSYVYIFLAHRYLLKPIDSIFMHLTMANAFTVVFLLIPYIASSFGVRRFLNDAGCKAILYIYRVTRGLSICTTSFLSTFQAIAISPSNTKWAWLKPKVSKWIFPSFFFSWVINMLIYIHIIHTVIAKNNASHAGQGYVHAFCKTRVTRNENTLSFFIVILTRDLLLVALMMSSSLYMVNLLFTHHRRTRHVHSRSLSSQTSPETKATHSILLLVCCFVFFYWLGNFITLYEFYTPNKIPRLEGINAILSSCYPTVCPFLLMRNNKIIFQFISSFSILRISCTQNTFSS